MSVDASMTPGTPASRYRTILLRLTGSGQWERALEVARDWLGEDPASAQAHLSAGQSLIHLKQYPPARQHLLKALEGDPRNGFAHRLISIACFHLRDYGKADDHIQQAISLNPNDPTHWYHLAWMRYKCGALEAGAKHARRSLELQPDDPNTLNLLTLCQGRTGPDQLAQYHRALELDPENESIHNNIGTYYLDVDRNYPAAEECFRRALMFDPANKTAQKNLFLVLRKRDPIYRALQFPSVMVDRLRWGNNRYGMLARIGLVALWLTLGRVLLGVLLLWLIFVFPLIKVYEYLTLGDIHAKAGLPGARRGGVFGFRRWPLGVRFGIFTALCAAFWGGVIFLCRDQFTQEAVVAVTIVAAMVFGGMFTVRAVKRSYRQGVALRAEKRLQKQMKSTVR